MSGVCLPCAPLAELLIDGQPIQLIAKEDSAVSETPRVDTPRSLDSSRSSESSSPSDSPAKAGRRLSSGLARAASFSRRESTASKRAMAEMLGCFHLLTLDKADGPVGITLANSDAKLANSSSKRQIGVVVHALEAGGTAQAAGLCVGDVIMAVNGKPVNDHREAIAGVDGASVVELKVWGVRPASSKTLYKGHGLIGVTVANHERGLGVLIASLQPGGQAHQVGLREGDCILAINGHIVLHHSLAVALMDEANDAVEITFVARDGGEPEVALRSMEA